MTSKSRCIQRANRRAQQGLSLVELMVAMTIGLFLMGAVGVIYVNTSTTSRSSTLESQMNEDAALALELLQQQIRLAGFSNVDNTGARLFPGRGIRGCDGGFTDNDGGLAFENPLLACNAAGAGPDALAVRYEASLLNSQPVTAAGGVQSPGNCAHEGLAAWNALAEGAAAATPLALADNRYYIANDADGTPSLFCHGRTGTGFGTAIALIPNIEDLQIQYAVTALPTAGNPIPHQVAGYVDASATDAAGAPVLGAPAVNWSRVSALRICLLARTARSAPTGDNSRDQLGSYRPCDPLDPAADPVTGLITNNDGFLRRTYVTTIQLRNMRPGLPADYVAGNDPWAYLYE